MTLENRLLEKLAEQPGSSRRHEFQASDAESGWNLYLTAERRDDLSCLVWEFSLRLSHPQAGDLKAWAEGIAGRTQALTERLQVNEIDAIRGEALLRTQPILKREHRFYYEAVLQGTGSITVRRYQVLDEIGQRREQVAFAMTNETLARLAGELTGA
jgi:hypothetical protein